MKIKKLLTFTLVLMVNSFVFSQQRKIETGDLFDYQKLQDLITTYGKKSAQEVIDQLMVEADAWLSGKHNPDDITLVVIKHK